MQFIDPRLRDGRRELTAEVGSPVRRHHVPNWLRLRLLKVLKGDNRDTSGWSVLMRAEQQFELRYWLDHWGSAVVPDHDHPGREITAFVAEPYVVSDSTMRNALDFAETIGCRLDVSACSEWYPTSTLRLTFIPRGA